MITRIAIVDDHAILRAGLMRLVEENQNFQVVAEMSSAQELLDSLPRLNVDMLLLDITMPGLSGLDILANLRSDYPHIKIVILTMHASREFFKQALLYKVEGYLLKDDLYESLIEAIQQILSGENYYSSKVTNTLMQGYNTDIQLAAKLEGLLTPREREVIEYVVKGRKSKEISEAMNISVRTVETHRSKIMRKLGATSMAELINIYAAGIPNLKGQNSPISNES